MEKILKMLLEYQDSEYGDFAAKLSPELNRSEFLGIRVPNIRNVCKRLTSSEKIEFLKELPHKYYEENQLHGFIIASLNDYDLVVKSLNEFLPYANSWAITDTMIPKIFKKHKDQAIEEIKKWLKSKHTYTIRFAVDNLMSLYLDDGFDVNHFDLINEINSDEYYVNMMIAWYYATALAKRWDEAIKVLESKTLSKWVHNKTIQKAIESYRITNSQKEYLKTLKIK